MEDTVDVQEALKILNLSRATLYKIIQDGRLVPVKQRTALKRPRPRFKRSDLERLLEKDADAPEAIVAA